MHRMHRLHDWAVCLGSLGLATALLLTSACVSTPDRDAERTPAQNAEARRNIGIDHINNGRIPFGIRELRHALTLNEADPMTHLFIGQAYQFSGKTKEAVQHTERALELDPTTHEARIQLSTLYIMEGKLGEAIAQADILIEDPTFSSPWRALSNRGWAQVKQNRTLVARESLVEALQFRGSYWPALLNLAILEQIEGDHLAALRYFQEVLDLEPGPGAESECHYRMGEAYVSLGHRTRAIDHLVLSMEASPHGRWGNQAREYLGLLQ